MNIYSKRSGTWSIVFVLLLFALSAFGQSNKINAWSIKQYSDNIIKVSIKPKSYTKNENISDAVILKPLFKKAIPYKVISENAIVVGDRKKVEIHYINDSDKFQGFTLALSDEEKIYGGGGRALPLNRRGYAFNLYNNPWYGYEYGADNLNFSVPFFTSSNGYGLFFDNPSRGKADLGHSKKDQLKVTFCSGELNIFIIFGENPEDILSEYHKLTGTQGLLPRWTMGNFMSRFGYSSENQVFDIANKMKEEKIPFDAVIFDLFWFGDSIKGTMGNLAWMNKTKWPNPKGMLKKLKDQNIKSILITEPFILKSSQNYDSSKDFHAVDSLGKPYVLTDFYFGEGGLIDIFRKDAGQWFWNQHDAQNRIGVDAWWGDLGEPEKHPGNLYHNLKNLGFNRLFSADEVHNIYGHYWTKLLYQNYALKYPKVRLFSLNRSGFSGSQRYNIVPWSGDVSRNWNGLKAQLPLMLGMSMSGIPYIHSDAGGFAGGNGDNELYVRWLQLSLFSPIFRPHGTALFDIDPNAFSFPSEPALIEEPYKSMARNIVQLRYQLLAYNYTLVYNQTMFGKPLISPLYYAFPNDGKAASIEDQFLWGENIMVAPVIEKNVIKKECYLPSGDWYEWNLISDGKDKLLTGNIIADAPLDKIPCFIRAGSFIPIIEKTGTTTVDFSTDTLNIHYYYDRLKASQYTMYDDDGMDKNALTNHQFELITFAATPSKDEVLISVKSNGGKYKTKPKSRHINLIVHGFNTNIKTVISQKTRPIKTVIKGNKISFDFSGGEFKINLLPAI
jgi:oligosaccharide 4-alpha-D-glucosyltransferase